MHQKLRQQLNIHTISGSYTTRKTMHPFNPLFFKIKKKQKKKLAFKIKRAGLTKHEGKNKPDLRERGLRVTR
jgi:hypothetical protein